MNTSLNEDYRFAALSGCGWCVRIAFRGYQEREISAFATFAKALILNEW
jgi:hypothetical protein